jgi:hypothetical protein
MSQEFTITSHGPDDCLKVVEGVAAYKKHGGDPWFFDAEDSDTGKKIRVRIVDAFFRDGKLILCGEPE